MPGRSWSSTARTRCATGWRPQLGREKRVVTSVSGLRERLLGRVGDRPADDGLRRPAEQTDRRAAAAARPERDRPDGPRRAAGRRPGATRASGCARATRRCSLRDFSGKPSAVNEPLLRLLLDHGYTPVLTVPARGRAGVRHQLRERRRGGAAAGRAEGRRTSIELIEAPGLLRDPADPASVVRVARRRGPRAPRGAGRGPLQAEAARAAAGSSTVDGPDGRSSPTGATPTRWPTRWPARARQSRGRGAGEPAAMTAGAAARPLSEPRAAVRPRRRRVPRGGRRPALPRPDDQLRRQHLRARPSGDRRGARRAARRAADAARQLRQRRAREGVAGAGRAAPDGVARHLLVELRCRRRSRRRSSSP